MNKTVKLTFEDGAQSEYTIETMPVARFRRAWAATKPDLDELKVLDLAFNQPDGWSVELAPESYTTATEAMYEVNKDFFGSVARRRAFDLMTG